MKSHILLAMYEQFEHWDILLARLSDSQIATPLASSHWTIKDELNHLWAWQQRSIARIEAALHNHDPVFPQWLQGVDPGADANTDKVNAWIYETYHDLSWAQARQQWHDGYLKLLDLANGISERDLLNSEKYPWMKGSPLVFVLLGSYDHHQEHLEALQAGLNDPQ